MQMGEESKCLRHRTPPMAPRLMRRQERGAIRIQEDIHSKRLDLLICTQPMFEKVPLPNQAPGRQRRTGPGLDAGNHLSQRKPEPKREQPMHVVGHNRECPGGDITVGIYRRDGVPDSVRHRRVRQINSPKTRAPRDKIDCTGLRDAMRVKRAGVAHVHRGELTFAGASERGKVESARSTGADQRRPYARGVRNVIPVGARLGAPSLSAKTPARGTRRGAANGPLRF